MKDVVISFEVERIHHIAAIDLTSGIFYPQKLTSISYRLGRKLTPCAPTQAANTNADTPQT